MIAAKWPRRKPGLTTRDGLMVTELFPLVILIAPLVAKKDIAAIHHVVQWTARFAAHL
jgi:hypothetical protein